MPKSLLLSLFLVGCSLTPKPTQDSGVLLDDSDPTGGTGSGLTVSEIRNGDYDTQDVQLDGVVVTSNVTRDMQGFFVQDLGGGPETGIYVWSQGGFDDTYFVNPGDLVNITGYISEYYGWTELVVSSPESVQVSGSGAVPTPTDLGDAATADWDQYESTLVTVTNQTITAIDSYNTATLSGGVALDDGFLFLDYDCGGAYDSITGVVFYSYEVWSINPRSEADLVGYTAGGASTGGAADVQHGTICGTVTLEDVVVTTPVYVDDEGALFFVQDAGGGEWSGLAVFLPDATEADVEIGDVISVAGSAGEFYEFTELRVEDASTLTVDGTGTPEVIELTTAPSDWEPYEGTLVRIVDVEATSDPDYGEFTTNYNIKIDDMFVENDAHSGDTWAAVTGVVNFSYSEFKIEPREVSDYE